MPGLLIYLTISIFSLAAVLGSQCHARNGILTPPKGPIGPQGELRILAEGLNSSVPSPFIAVSRDAETYARLRELDINLPILEERFFKSNFVIAAFLGQRPTGGYKISITEQPGGFTVREERPETGTIVTEMITMPFKLVAIPSGMGGERVRIVLDNSWKDLLANYRVESGRFTTAGHLPVMPEDFEVTGKIALMRAGQLVTFFFRVYEKGRESGLIRGLSGSFTGIVTNETQVTIKSLVTWGVMRLDNKSLASGFFSDGGQRLSLSFTSFAVETSETSSGEGHIEATREEARVQG